MNRQRSDVATSQREPQQMVEQGNEFVVVRRTGIRCRRGISFRCGQFMVASVMTLLMTQSMLNPGNFASAFTMRMEYKPPVQTSVSKLLRSQRVPPKKDWKELSESSSSSSPPSRGSTSKNAAAAGALMAPLETGSLMPSMAPPPSFERRMRDLVFRNREKRSEGNSYVDNHRVTPSSLPENLRIVETLQDYKAVVGDEREKVVAVRFYAPWCKACKAVAPSYYHLANKYSDVVFVDVPVTERNSKLHQGLGITTLPFAHVYHPEGGLVEELRLTRKFIPNFEHKLQSYIIGSCELSDDLSSPYKEEDDESPSTVLR